MKYILLLVLACAACAPTPSYVTSQGLRVHAGETGERQEDIEALADALIIAMGPRWFGGETEVSDKLRGLIVHVEDGDIECTWGVSSLDKCYGIATVDLVRYQHMPCIAHSALAHELIHALLLRKSGWGDSGHVTVELWGLGGVESDARMACCYEACPEVCK